jgi:hypothetical protein
MTHSPVGFIGPIEQTMVEDQVRIDRWLARSANPDRSVNEEAYAHFRRDLWRHIHIEKDVLLPFARRRHKGISSPTSDALRAGHRELARLLARRPAADVIEELRERLAEHNAAEEGPEGLYAVCDRLAAEERVTVAEQLKRQAEPPLSRVWPYYVRR